jgi:hypothetical protein
VLQVTERRSPQGLNEAADRACERTPLHQRLAPIYPPGEYLRRSLVPGLAEVVELLWLAGTQTSDEDGFALRKVRCDRVGLVVWRDLSRTPWREEVPR